MTGLIPRRQLVTSGSVAGMALAAGRPATAMVAASLSGPYLDVNTTAGSLLAQRRLWGTIQPDRPRLEWFEGEVSAVAANGNTTPLMGVRGYAESRVSPEAQPGAWRRTRHVWGTFYDLATGSQLETFHNPLTGKRVPVIHIRTATISEPLSALPARAWRSHGANFVLDHADHIAIVGAHVTLAGHAMSSHTGLVSDLQDPSQPTIADSGTWTFVTGWMPWLNMSIAAGTCVFHCRRGGGTEIPAHLLADTNLT